MCIAPGSRRAAFIAAGLLNLHVKLPFRSAHLAAVSQRRFPGFSGLHAHVRDGRRLGLLFRNRFGCRQGERIRNDPFAPLDAGDHLHEVGVTSPSSTRFHSQDTFCAACDDVWWRAT